SLRSIYPIHAFPSRLKLWCLIEQQNGRRQEVNGAAAEDCCGELGISLRFIHRYSFGSDLLQIVTMAGFYPARSKPGHYLFNSLLSEFCKLLDVCLALRLGFR